MKNTIAPQMTTQRIFTVLFILIIVFSTSFGTERRASTSLPIFRGILSGMYLHTGYVGSRQFTFTHNGTEYKGRLQGTVWGIGGHSKALLGRHIRIGGEAYISNHRYENHSKASILWGGLVTDYVWTLGKRVNIITGNTIGGGSLEHVRIFRPIALDYDVDEPVAVRRYGFWCDVPYIACEYILSDRARLTFRTDYMLNISRRENDFFTGIRFYVGVTFRSY